MLRPARDWASATEAARNLQRTNLHWPAFRLQSMIDGFVQASLLALVNHFKGTQTLSPPAPMARVLGTIPATMAMVVITIGRARL